MNETHRISITTPTNDPIRTLREIAEKIKKEIENSEK